MKQRRFVRQIESNTIDMKTKILLIAAVAALALVPGRLPAQGFGHYPQKGAYDLEPQRPAENSQQVQAADAVPMSCPKCKDTFVSVAVPFSKGMEVNQTRTAAKHLCPNCATSINTEGMGRNARNTVVHSCTACGSADMSCCQTSKGGGATTGM